MNLRNLLRVLVQECAPRSPAAGGRDLQHARLTYYRSRDERKARAELYGGRRSIEVQPRGKR